jgi:hypothetical protein
MKIINSLIVIAITGWFHSMNGQMTFNDPLYPGQYHHKLIMADYLNNFPMIDGRTADGKEIVIAVVEQSININTDDVNWYKNKHEIPNNGIDDDENGFIDDFDGWRALSEDDNFVSGTLGFHGINVSTILGAIANNNLGCVGVAPGISILPVEGQSAGFIVDGLKYVLQQRKLFNQTNGQKGAFIVAVNLSFSFSSSLVCEVVEDLFEEGVLVVCSAGNNGDEIVAQGSTITSGMDFSFPTSCSTVNNKLISVAGSNKYDCRAIFNPKRWKGSDWEGQFDVEMPLTVESGTNFSTSLIHVTAPAEDVVGIEDDDPDKYQNGTSFSTPQVAGLVGLVYDVLCSGNFVDVFSNPKGIAELVRSKILSNSEIPLYGNLEKSCSNGRINVYKTLLDCIEGFNIPDFINLNNVTINEDHLAKIGITLTDCEMGTNKVLLKAGHFIDIENSTIDFNTDNLEIIVDNSGESCMVGNVGLNSSLSGVAWGLCIAGEKRGFKCSPIGGVPPYSFEWREIDNQGNQITTFVGNVSAGNLLVGQVGAIIECKITDAVGNISISTKRYHCLLEPAGPDPGNTSGNNNNNARTIFYPNPSSNYLTIETGRNASNARIYDLKGKLVFESNSFDKIINFNVEFLSNGLYLLELTNKNEESINHKLIILR